MITIRFAGWISDRIASLHRIRISKNYFQMGTGYGSGYPKRFYQCFEDSGFWKKLHIARSIIHYLQKHLFSLLWHDSKSVVSMVKSLYRNVIPFPLLIC